MIMLSSDVVLRYAPMFFYHLITPLLDATLLIADYLLLFDIYFATPRARCFRCFRH